MRKEADAWRAIADEELRSAEYLAEKHLFRMVCYHAQQSVEKNLKALFVDRGIEIPRTHNILDLIAALRKHNIATDLSEEEAVFLNSVYRSRYPAALGMMPEGEPSRDDAERALVIAKRTAARLRSPA
jgi:HEPN domain-containing protein